LIQNQTAEYPCKSGVFRLFGVKQRAANWESRLFFVKSSRFSMHPTGRRFWARGAILVHKWR
jgi:hypothetical protein